MGFNGADFDSTVADVLKAVYQNLDGEMQVAEAAAILESLRIAFLGTTSS